MIRAVGIDISTHQSAYDPSVKAHDFIVVRATYGELEDYRFNQHTESIKDVPVRGAYCYFRSGIDWKLQADVFLDLVTDRGFHFFALDFEKINNTPSMKFAREAKEWIDYVTAETGKKVILYSRRDIIHEWMYQYGNHWMREPEYEYWPAQWPYRGWNDRMDEVPLGEEWQPALPSGVDDWTFWQYSADGNGKGPDNGIKREVWHVLPPAVDMNVFNGTPQELLKWAGVEEEEEDDDIWQIILDLVDQIIDLLNKLRKVVKK